MKIMRLIDSIIDVAVADRYDDPKSKNRHYNLSHGSKGASTWRWYAGLDPRCFPNDSNCVVLDNDNYNLKPVYSKNKLLKDAKGNICYNIVTDSNPEHKHDILLLWSIPVRNCTDVEFSIDGDVDIVGTGYSGKSRGEKSTVTPAPVLEITGDCVLKWSGTTKQGKSVKQTVSYRYYESHWTIGVLEFNEVEDV